MRLNLVRLEQYIPEQLYKRLLDKDVKWSADGTELLGDLNFYNDDE